ncbi:MAG: hypothetical protein KF894_26175 [Labilithrix sp.]|nr:hypothetical protein [Labilithrix sp.]
MKALVLSAAVLVSSLAASAAAAAEPLTPDTPAAAPAKAAKKAAKNPKKKPAERKPEAAPEKIAPPTEVAAAGAPEATPVPLETLPPPPPEPVAAPAPAPAAPPPANPDRVETAPSDQEGSTRIEAIAGRTQLLGFAVGVRAGHRMANNLYVGGTAMVQTGAPGALHAYPAAEVGYDAKLGGARFMPYVGVGPMISIPEADGAKVQLAPLLFPGFSLRYEGEGSPFTAGADVRFLYLTEVDTALFALNLTAGLRF